MSPSSVLWAIFGILSHMTCRVMAFRPASSVTRFRPTSTPLPLLVMHETSPAPDSSSATPVINYLVSTPLESILPEQDLLLILGELLSSKDLIEDTEALVVTNWFKLEDRLRSEDRSIRQLLGEETTQRLLRSVGNIDGYDPDAVKAFLASDAISNLLTKLLYDGIYEFFQTIDVFGNIISRLPIIGPIRNQIRDETKKQLDKTLGPLVKSFLNTYTKVAVGEASNFVLSPANRKMFGSANQRLAESLIDRPLAQLLPSGEMTAKLRDDAFEYIRAVEVDDFQEYVSFVYGFLGDKSLDAAVDVGRVLESSPTLRRTVDHIWAEATAAQAAESANGADSS